ncbi:hypothetical protein POV27_07570 [Aureisphaera galaxeae]|uniref:hypothetical protein n=1 Tax=Aureisphaera galaxeae TaxID=1538023 RepID=UPI00235087A5|nr:hypothetical protein [Aureisphaera galaxeae]MDC8003906.1 hypothetical protein [Aureisphaera galaxeae]
MKTYLLLFVAFFAQSYVYSQKIDSLKMFMDNDWSTYFRWFDSDTVVLKSIPKIDTVYTGLTRKEMMRKKRRNFLGERISFPEGKLKYSYTMYCPVGERYKKVNSIELVDNHVIVDFQSKRWPWRDHEWVFSKVKFRIFRWTPDHIILIKRSQVTK